MPTLGKVYQNRGRWFIRLPNRIQIYCDRNHLSFYSLQHAQNTLTRIHAEMENGTFDPDFYSKTRRSVHDFVVFAEDWLRLGERKVQLGKWSRDYFGHVRKYVTDLFVPAFRGQHITEIRGKQIHQFFLSLEHAPKTVFNIMSILHKLFQDAFDMEVIPVVPKFPVELKASELPDPEWSWADEPTQEKIFEYLEPEDLYFILFQACHGTRTGETRALQHGDIDLNNDAITVARAFSGQELRHTKSKRIRRIPLDPVWKEIYLSRPRCISPREFVFQRNGKPFSRTYAWRRWSEACKKAGVGGLTLYAGTRHSLASQAVNSGAPIYSIAKFLGHSNLKMTERYSHLDINSLKQVQRKSTSRTKLYAKCMQTDFRKVKGAGLLAK